MSTVSQNSLTSFHRSLRRWYDTHGRKNLPWRNVLDPYPVYISEIMLQQTQVTTVLERFYFQFLKRFPTLASLAKADRDDVLKAWQGLGYYQRARNLHEAAKRCKGVLPGEVEALMELPGIGKNTAHAVAAFAFGKKTAVMEANVKRAICRIFALTRPSEAELWEKAVLLLDKCHSFDYNQAMMDIGATICTKRAPKCAQCPASKICKGKDSPEAYPTAIAKKARLCAKSISSCRTVMVNILPLPAAGVSFTGSIISSKATARQRAFLSRNGPTRWPKPRRSAASASNTAILRWKPRCISWILLTQRAMNGIAAPNSNAFPCLWPNVKF
jgi:A/G-specific adenine glycosylase